jgi:hypothetical protein
MMITKKLKYVMFSYDEKMKQFFVKGVGSEYSIVLPRHYMVSLMRFGLRILQKGKPRK